MNSQYYIGIMSGTSMDGADAVLIRMQGTQWQAALAHAFIPFSDGLRRELLSLQNTGSNELHRSMILAQQLSRLYAEVVRQLLDQAGLSPADITAIGCHGQTVRHAPEHAYSIQLADLPLLAELSGIFTVGDFRSRDLAAGGQGAPLVPAFHQALFRHSKETRVVLNIGGISNISVLPPDNDAFGFDTGPGNMLMDAWVQHIWHIPYDKNGEKSAQGQLLPDLLERLLDHPYFAQPYPKSTGRELFSLDWLQGRLKTAGFAKMSETNFCEAKTAGFAKMSETNFNEAKMRSANFSETKNFSERPEDVLATLLHYTARTIYDAVQQAAPNVKNLYICGGGIRNRTLMQHLEHLFAPQTALHSTAQLNLDPQWIEAAAFGWLAACWINRTPSNPPHATGARKACILGTGCYA